jgi:hypothetical protein
MNLLEENEAAWTELRDSLLERAFQKRENLAWSELPEKIQQLFTEGLESYGQSVTDSLNLLIGDYFTVQDAHELVRWGLGQDALSIRVSQRGRRSVLFAAKVATGSKTWDTTWHLPPKRSLAAEVPDFADLTEIETTLDVYSLARYLLSEYWDKMTSASGFPRGDAYYLPAGRSGTLGVWQVFASMALEFTRRRFGLQRIEVPAVPGVTRDFLQTFLDISQRRSGRQMRLFEEMATVIDALHAPIFQGEITFSGRRADQPFVVYNTGNSQIPIHRSSSMVAELAPLSLWVQHVLQPGDLVIIDEPEAHLHPENQRRIATVLVRLVRAGVTVLCTTHSSLILHQLSNHILLSHAKPQEREGLGFTPDDVLAATDLGVYLFDPGPDGSQIKPVPIDPETGIEEEEFVRVMEAIGEETYRLAVQRDQVAG